jgi:hypothetical protein
MFEFQESNWRFIGEILDNLKHVGTRQIHGHCSYITASIIITVHRYSLSHC